MIINTGRWNQDELEQLLKEAHRIKVPGERVSFISESFLGTPYKAGTLIGGAEREEELVINLACIDCFTFLDYVEAMRRSSSFREFCNMLKRVRYSEGVLDYKKRNHFFIQWGRNNHPHMIELFRQLDLKELKMVQKTLNKKNTLSYYLDGIKPFPVNFQYLPSKYIEKAIHILGCGDYAGFYTSKEGLDVSHVGIVIRKGNTLFLRHASSRKDTMMVIDEPFIDYLKRQEGLIIFRPV